jgi:hypothetical protein
MARYFTLQEADETLETIRPMMEEVVRISQKVIASQPEIWPALERSAGNGGNATLSKLVWDFEKLDTLLHRVQDTGALVKDMASGLLDFPAIRNGQEVYLCWKVGEDGIEYWHEVEAGFAGRQSINNF